jgi:hypothetical protein
MRRRARRSSSLFPIPPACSGGDPERRLTDNEMLDAISRGKVVVEWAISGLPAPRAPAWRVAGGAILGTLR